MNEKIKELLKTVNDLSLYLHSDESEECLNIIDIDIYKWGECKVHICNAYELAQKEGIEGTWFDREMGEEWKEYSFRYGGVKIFSLYNPENTESRELLESLNLIERSEEDA